MIVIVGNGLLVYPITEADVNQVSVYFPGENTVRKDDGKILRRIFVYFSIKVWYDIRTFTQHSGLETVLINIDMESVNPLKCEKYTYIICIQIPVFQCGGTIIPQRLRKRRASTLAIHDPITLVIALDRNVRLKLFEEFISSLYICLARS